MKGSRREEILGYFVYRDGAGCCVDDIMQAMSSGCRSWLACLNPHSFAVALDRQEFRMALLEADWVVPDGVGIVLASWLLGGGVRRRLTGSDVFSQVNSALQERGGGTVFLLGSTNQTLEAMRARMMDEWPRVKVVGTWSPPFKETFTTDDNEVMVQRINAVRPDILWVGMTAPKQEEWIHAILPRLEVKFAAAIGAVFDFYAGQIRRSHPVFQRLGLEWLPRLVQEPRRLWRRSLVSAPVFVWHVLRRRMLG